MTETRFTSSNADPSAYNALTTGVAFLRNPNSDLVVASGNDVVKLLQGLVLNDVFKLAEPGSGQLNCSVNNVGRLLSLFHVLHIHDLLLLDLPQDAVHSGFLAHLKNHVIGEDAHFNDKSAGIEKFVIAGPNSLKLLAILGNATRDPASLVPFNATELSLPLPTRNAEAILLRTDALNGIDSFEMIVAKEDADAIESRLLSEGTPRFPLEMYDYVRLDRLARARWGLELDEEVIPLEGDLNPIVSYEKGCYLGQEIIARLDSRNRFAKRLCTVEVDTLDVPDPGTKVLLFDETQRKFVVVGKVICAIYSERRAKTLFRAYLKRPGHELGAVVNLDGNESEGVVIQVAERVAEGVDP